MRKIKNLSGRPYEIYTPFYRKAITVPVDQPVFTKTKYTIKNIKTDMQIKDINQYYKNNPYLAADTEYIKKWIPELKSIQQNDLGFRHGGTLIRSMI